VKEVTPIPNFAQVLMPGFTAGTNYYTVDTSTITNASHTKSGLDFANQPTTHNTPIGGTKYKDVNGDDAQNGIGADDTALAGVTVGLYIDNGNGSFDPGVDQLVPKRPNAALFALLGTDNPQQTLANGSYAFNLDYVNADLANGTTYTFFVVETV